MSVLKPFKAIRPKKEYAASVAALPYDVMNTQEARIAVKDNPLSFLHVDKAEIDLPEGTYLYDKQVYLKARENLDALSEKGVCIQDKTENLYVYRQIMDGRAQTGVVGCASIDDYMNNIIKKHELTRADKEEDRINHVDYCDANTGPIFLTYRGNDTIDSVVAKYTASEAEYDFTTQDGIRNTVWVIDNKDDIDALTEAFRNIEYLYIADGHHRAASAVKVGMMRRQANPDYTGTEEFNFFLAVYFKSDDLAIMDYNRLIADYNGKTKEKLLSEIAEKFDIEKNDGIYHPEKKHTFGMYIDSEWYKLTAKDGTFDENDPVDRLDVSILQKNVITPVFGIEDPRTDKRIDFVGGIRGLGELERRCTIDMQIAFSMYPTTLDDLMDIADAEKIMPPKSTWFEPKLLSGLFIHKLS
ncbi:MAG: DUF1015 domain-containing protein [Clostridia bacterium]|nr:DUF1015 domain-containing protein [Clostridia bacterium]